MTKLIYAHRETPQHSKLFTLFQLFVWFVTFFHFWFSLSVKHCFQKEQVFFFS